MTTYRKVENDEISNVRVTLPCWVGNTWVAETATNEDMAGRGFFPETSSVPTYDIDTHKLVGPVESFSGSEISIIYTVEELTTEEKAAKKKKSVPQKVSMRRARLAMLKAGILDKVQAAVDAMTGDEGKVAQIEWEYADGLSRTHLTLQAIAEALGLTDDDIDDLFIAAGKIPE